MRVPSSWTGYSSCQFPGEIRINVGLHKLRNLSCLGNSLHALLKQATHTQLRLDVDNSSAHAPAPHSSAGIVRVVVVNAALCGSTVSCALQSIKVMARFRVRAFFPW